MTEATMQELMKESVALIRSTELAIAQVEANEDITDLERVYSKERLMLTKLTQQLQYASLKAVALLQEQYELNQQQKDLLENQYEQLLTVADLNGKIHDQAIVIDNILTLAAPTEGKSH